MLNKLKAKELELMDLCARSKKEAEEVVANLCSEKIAKQSNPNQTRSKFRMFIRFMSQLTFFLFLVKDLLK